MFVKWHFKQMQLAQGNKSSNSSSGSINK